MCMKYKVYTEEESNKIENLEQDLLSMANGYSLRKWRIPAMISKDILEKCGYLETMPNQLTLAGFLSESQCKAVSMSKAINEISFENMFFTPAACLHFYPLIKEKKVFNEIITTNARVYRHENGFFSKERLWDFNVREFVAVGNSEFVKSFLRDFIKKSLLLSRKFDKNCQIKSSNDHFYSSPTNKIKMKYQKANKLKYELVNSDSIAIASFNYHGYHFSKNFRFDQNGSIVSGCVGFGLDRWLQMIEKGVNNE